MTIEPLDETSTAPEFPKQLDLAQVCIYGLSLLSAGIFLFLPFFNLLHPSPWQRSIGTIHSFGSLLATVIAVYAGHLAFPLLRGSAKVLPQVRTLIFWVTSIAFLAIATGNWAYMRFSADLEFGGGKAWLKENSPLVPTVLSNYHKFSTCGLYLDFMVLWRCNFRKKVSRCFVSYLCCPNGANVLCDGWLSYWIRYG
jgi:hypothetical protein